MSNKKTSSTTLRLYVNFLCEQLKISQTNVMMDILLLEKDNFESYLKRGVNKNNPIYYETAKVLNDAEPKDFFTRIAMLWWNPGFFEDYYKKNNIEPTEAIRKTSREKRMILFFEFLREQGFYITSDVMEYIPKIEENTFIAILQQFLQFDLKTENPDKFVEFLEAFLLNKFRSDKFKSYIYPVILAILNTTLPDYTAKKDGINKEKSCPLTRTALISLIKHFSDDGTSSYEIIDNFLSEDTSARALNTEISQSKNVMLKAIFEHGFEFKGREDGVILVKYDGENSSDLKNIDKDELFNTVKVLFDAYKGMGEEFHNDFYSLKKKELNQTISQFVNAVARKGVFNTTERRKVYVEMVSYLIKTHNHDSNYIQPLLRNIYEEKPAVNFKSNDEALSVITDIVGEYSTDIYNTDINSMPFIPNLLNTLDTREGYCNEIKDKVNTLFHLLLNKRLYNLQIINEIIKTDKTKEGVIWSYIENTFVSIGDKRPNELTADDKRNMVVFACMFARGRNTRLFNSCAERNMDRLARFYRLILKELRTLSQEFPNRKKDIAQGLSFLIVYLCEINPQKARGVFEYINMYDSLYSDCGLLSSTFEYVVNGNITNLFWSYYKRLFGSCEKKEYISNIIEKFAVMDEDEKSDNHSLFIKTLLYAKNIPDLLEHNLLETSDRISMWLIKKAIEDINNAQTTKALQNILSINKTFAPENSLRLITKKNDLFNKLFENLTLINIPINVFFDYYKANKNSLKSLMEHNEFDDNEIKARQHLLVGHCLKNPTISGATDLLLYNYQFAIPEDRVQIKQFCKDILKSKDFHHFNSKQLEHFVDILWKNEDVGFAECQDLLFDILKLKDVTAHTKLKLFDKASNEETCYVIAKKITESNVKYIDLVYSLLELEYNTKPWARVYLYPLLSELLSFDCFVSLDSELQINLIHYTKTKQEYYGHFRLLLTHFAEKNAFIKLSNVVKTALIIHFDEFGLDISEERFKCYSAFIDEIINDLIKEKDKHIKMVYGLRSETLIYHIIKINKFNPEKTAIICARSLFKLYKQLLQTRQSINFELYDEGLLNNRISGFEKYVSNPCITNIAICYCEKIRLFINANFDKKDSLLEKLNKILVKVNNKNSPCIPYSWWFDLESCLLNADDSISSEKQFIDLFSFEIDSAVDLSSYEKAEGALQKWRQLNNSNEPLNLSEETEVIAIKQSNGKYYPVSGWPIIYECQKQNQYDIVPSKIATTVISIGSVKELQFLKENIEHHKNDDVYQMFEDLFTYIKTTVKGHIKRKRFVVSCNAHNEQERHNIEIINSFLEFYYEFVKYNKLKLYTVEPYYDYYDYVNKNINDLLK